MPPVSATCLLPIGPSISLSYTFKHTTTTTAHVALFTNISSSASSPISTHSAPRNSHISILYQIRQRERPKMTEAVIRKKPGMVSVKDMPILQDGPPPGGFPPVRYARRIPNKGPSAVAIFLAAFGAFSWGMYQVGKGNKIRRALKEEKYASRRAILPLLQAEEDERFVKEWKKYLEYEAEVMKDVPGWKVGENVYNSGKWVPPATGELRPDVW